MKGLNVSVTKYVEVEVDVHIDEDDLRQCDDDKLMEICTKKGISCFKADRRAEIDAAYLSLTPTTPEPIRALVLELAGRIA